ncbi:hypothetical protein Esti_005798 [Eimeria stiedai]
MPPSEGSNILPVMAAVVRTRPMTFPMFFAVVKSQNNLSDNDLVRLVVHHVRGDALLWIELSDNHRTQHLLDNWAAFKSALRRRFVQWSAGSTDTQKLIYGLYQIGSARSACSRSSSFKQRSGARPHRSSRSVLAANKGGPTSARNVEISSASSMSSTQPLVDKLAALPGPSAVPRSPRLTPLINSPKQLFFEGTVNKHPTTFWLDGGADHSIMSKNCTVTNGITMHPLDPPISTTFENNSSEVIPFAIEPLQLQCQGHRSLVQPLVSSNVSFDLLVGLDWLAQNNPLVDWDNGSLSLSDSAHCYKWEAVYPYRLQPHELQQPNAYIRKRLSSG